MNHNLIFQDKNYEVKTYILNGKEISYRAFENISYCTNPKASVQIMHLFVPEIYYEGKELHGYNLKTAPIFMPNTVGGYMEGPAAKPGLDRFGHANSTLSALMHGYVVACAGIRGRTTGKTTTEFFEGSSGEQGEATGQLVGKAPALIIDMKAAIRYLRHNKDLIPGNTDYIITNGTSAGGALSALAGATGNCPEYDPYLEEIGAAKERDDIFAASCYCPIHNLEHADSAYEWMFHEQDHFHWTRYQTTPHGVEYISKTGVMTEKQQQLSKELKALFPSYLNSLELKGKNGTALILNADGTGSFLETVKKYVISSAQKELDTHDIEKHLSLLAVEGSEIEQQDYFTIKDGTIVDIDWSAYITKIERMKVAPAFDSLDLSSPENEEFGTEEIAAQHFTDFAFSHSEANGNMADETLIRLLNPTLFLDNPNVAPHWRIRHGAFDRDTALAIPVILATLLDNKGLDVDFFLPWGLPHSGDYDLDKLFAWIDSRVKED